jgi:hypothetical protein
VNSNSLEGAVESGNQFLQKQQAESSNTPSSGRKRLQFTAPAKPAEVIDPVLCTTCLAFKERFTRP